MERIFTENGDEWRQYYDLVTLKSRLFPLENLLYEITHGIINLKFESINIVRLRIQHLFAEIKVLVRQIEVFINYIKNTLYILIIFTRWFRL
jgi:hypothetical protein